MSASAARRAMPLAALVTALLAEPILPAAARTPETAEGYDYTKVLYSVTIHPKARAQARGKTAPAILKSIHGTYVTGCAASFCGQLTLVQSDKAGLALRKEADEKKHGFAASLAIVWFAHARQRIQWRLEQQIFIRRPRTWQMLHSGSVTHQGAGVYVEKAGSPAVITDHPMEVAFFDAVLPVRFVRAQRAGKDFRLTVTAENRLPFPVKQFRPYASVPLKRGRSGPGQVLVPVGSGLHKKAIAPGESASLEFVFGRASVSKHKNANISNPPRRFVARNVWLDVTARPKK